MSDTRRRGKGGKDRYRKVRRAIVEAEARYPFVGQGGNDHVQGRVNRKLRRRIILEARREVGR